MQGSQHLRSLLGFLGGASGKESAYQCWRHGFDPRVRKICWSRKWQLTPVLLPGGLQWGRKALDVTEHAHTYVLFITLNALHRLPHLIHLTILWHIFVFSGMTVPRPGML